MIFQIIAAFIATFSFSIMFNVSKNELIYCGITGAIGWLFYNIALNLHFSVITACFISTLIITTISRILANIRKTPITVFLISGIILLVPGAGIYYTMLNIINYKNMEAVFKGIETFKIAGIIAIGIIIILSLPQKLFIMSKNK